MAGLSPEEPEAGWLRRERSGWLSDGQEDGDGM